MVFIVITIFNVSNLIWTRKNKHPKNAWLYKRKPPNISMNMRYVVLIIPLMNRDPQLAVFESHMCSMWNNKSSPLLILVVNQTAPRSFSRSWLFNVGLNFIGNQNISSTCIAIHDVDLLPFSNVSYETCDHPTQLSSELEHFNWNVPYDSSSGGVFLASKKDWLAINGMSNLFRGWGGEDDELFYRLKHARLTDGDRPYRPARGYGKFYKNKIEHHVSEKSMSEYISNVRLLDDMVNKKRSMSDDGLAQVKYGIVQIKSKIFWGCNAKAYHISVTD